MTFDERRSELIDAAIRVISRDGLAAATTRAIVSEADMPQGALFYIFSSRDSLLGAVIEHITDQEQLTVLLSADMIDKDASLHDVIVGALDGYLGLLAQDPSREIALLELATHGMRHDQDALRHQWQTYRAAVADALRYLSDRLDFHWRIPLDQLAHLVTSTLDGITISWLTDRDCEAARRNIDIIATTITALAIGPAEDEEPS
ncbi:MAG: TetR family transcriptional regulator [Gordonia sp. (in: high G+C Gram-positive bacteria)]